MSDKNYKIQALTLQKRFYINFLSVSVLFIYIILNII